MPPNAPAISPNFCPSLIAAHALATVISSSAWFTMNPTTDFTALNPFTRPWPMVLPHFSRVAPFFSIHTFQDLISSVSAANSGFPTLPRAICRPSWKVDSTPLNDPACCLAISAMAGPPRASFSFAARAAAPSSLNALRPSSPTYPRGSSSERLKRSTLRSWPIRALSMSRAAMSAWMPNALAATTDWAVKSPSSFMPSPAAITGRVIMLAMSTMSFVVPTLAFAFCCRVSTSLVAFVFAILASILPASMSIPPIWILACSMSALNPIRALAPWRSPK